MSGHISKLLANPVCTGEVAHGGVRDLEEHQALIDCESRDAVQAQLERSSVVWCRDPLDQKT